MSNRQVAILCACIVVACSGYKHFQNEGIFGVARRIEEWLK